ncbi:hypothetical protein [Sinorhizobium meliloti]|uniref:hypothetical protein n=1 Tax=Rhizobium meliloti TaxID=382 RepID=UPI00040E8791|nr:hypothetical protein [Sinorhizobium meliloti]RVG08624.1 hypothetical protein CN231_26865 [Sinorhizobium meliloti]UFX06660.1 hypothetical protein SmelRRI128_09200 [Sinorhizobium meliloti]
MTSEAFIQAEEESLPEAFERSRHSFGGGGLFAIIVLPDGSSFRVVPDADMETAQSTRLSSAETIAELMMLYGVSAFRVN